MYPTAYTLTVLVLTLLQYSFDKRHANTACQNGLGQEDNSTVICQHNVSRKEIRQLNRREFESFVQVFNEYSTRNDSDELNANINELGVVQIFDELLQSRRMLTPFWDYRLELNAENPESSPLWSAQQFKAVNQASDAQWLVEFIDNENSADDDEFFGDDPFSKLWKRRRAALKLVRNLKKTDVFWHLLLLVSIETGMDQTELQINRTSCVLDFGKFTRWINDSCQVALNDGEQCKSSGDCYSRRCSKNQCASSKRHNTLLTPTILSEVKAPETTALPTILSEVKAPETTELPVTTIPTSSSFKTTTELPVTTIPTSTEITEPVNVSSGQDESQPQIDEATTYYAPTKLVPTVTRPTHSSGANHVSNEIPLLSRTLQTTTIPSKAPEFQPKYVFRLDPLFGQQESQPIDLTSPQPKEHHKVDSKLAVTTEFLAKELSTPYPSFNFGPTDEESVKKGRKKGKKRKKNRKLTTTPEPHDQIPPTETYSDPTLATIENTTLLEDNNPIDQENYSSDTLDALLVYLPTPKVPTMIAWTSKMPLKMAYFGFTIIEGNLGKQRRLKEKGQKRAKGARIYVRGLGMPSGYTQITQGRQVKSGIGALGRVLNPNDNEPFVEFKMRVENRYGTPCKQMCLDANQRYRRCARRTVRLSPYKKFSDPIPYFDTENLAMNGQFTGKGYYRKRKLTYLLFKCE